MNPVKQLHRDAMELHGQAELMRMKEMTDEAAELLMQAFMREKEAARNLTNTLGAEPTRSVLFRGAATLAKQCGLLREAEQLVCEGLVGNPPSEIADELRDLFDEINYWRHLKTKGHELSRSEFQLSLAGAAIGLGMAENNEVLDRIQRTTTMVYRTAQRTRGDSFAEDIPRGLKRDLEVQMSAPREAASFAIGFRITHAPSKHQLALPGMSWPEQVVDELMTCMHLLQSKDTSKLAKRFNGQGAYLRNFLTLSGLLAPDGERVKLVGFTAWQNGNKRQVAFDKSSDDVQEVAHVALPEPHRESIIIQGILLRADSETSEKRLRITDKKGKKYNTIIKEGLGDLVRALFEQEVIVRGDYDGKTIINAEVNRVSQ